MKLSDLDAVNDVVNALPYVADATRYHQADFWAQIDSQGGDCEDYAIGKLNRLVDMGWPVSLLKLACCYDELGEYHAVLIVSADDGDYVLDNRQPRPVPMGDVSQVLGYRPDRMQAQGGSREWVEWRIA